MSTFAYRDGSPDGWVILNELEIHFKLNLDVTSRGGGANAS